MKNTIKIVSALATAVALLSSCNVDNIGAEYVPTTGGATLAQAVINSTEIPATQNTFNVDVYRGNADGALTVNVSSELPEGISCPSSITFESGSYTSTIPLDISQMSIGNTYKGSISIEVSEAEAKIATTTASFTLAKAYNWISLGTGFFFEGFWEGFLSDCEVFKAEGFDRYRFMKPYSASEEAVNAGPSYFEFWVINDDKNVKFDTFVTPFDYDGAGSMIKGYWPSDLNSKYADHEAETGFYEDDIIVLFPCWYIDGLGGWASSFYAIALCLPGRSEDSFIEWLGENGLL